MPRILITTSTGKQGRSTIAALHSLSPTTEILALTRDPTSSTAQSLASTYPSLTLIQGNPTDPEPIFAKAGKVDALCLITVPGKDGDEERQALPMIDAALRHGVGHVVFNSVERGGEEVSEENPTEIEHFASKHRIEKYLRDKLTDKQTTWTILRPVAFMDNLIPGFGAKAFTGLWQTIGPKPLQLISCHDIGHFAALSLLSPPEYASRCIGLAGDELNITQARAAFQTALGQPLPETWGFVGQGIKFFGGEFGKMFEWFRTDGYGVDIGALRREYPALQDFGTWLREDSGFRQ